MSDSRISLRDVGPADAELTIALENGAAQIDGFQQPLLAGLSIAIARSELDPVLHRHRDHGNGFEWLDFHRLAFGGWPCRLSACFQEGYLVDMIWWISRTWPYDDPWPSERELSEQLETLRRTLQAQLLRPFQGASERFVWGDVRPHYQYQTGAAQVALRYQSGTLHRFVH